MSQTSPHYREFIAREFQLRSRKNPGYSLRAYARDLGMPPSKLSEVLRGIRGLSRTTAKMVCERIRLSPDESSLFLDLVDFHQTKNQSAKKVAEERLRTLAREGEWSEMNLERFKIISDWYHFAILELTETQEFESNPSWIAGRLGIKTTVAREAINRLVEFGLLEADASGTLRQTKRNLATPSGIPSREIREHHSQILMKAEQALQTVDVYDRDFSSTTLAFDKSQLDEIRNELKKLRRRIGQKIQDRSPKDRVYCLAIQFFPLDTNNN